MQKKPFLYSIGIFICISLRPSQKEPKIIENVANILPNDINRIKKYFEKKISNGLTSSICICCDKKFNVILKVPKQYQEELQTYFSQPSIAADEKELLCYVGLAMKEQEPISLNRDDYNTLSKLPNGIRKIIECYRDSKPILQMLALCKKQK